MNIQEIRSQYPQYADMSDDDLGRALHGKFYSDMPYDAFATKVGIRPEKPFKVGAEGLPDAISEVSKNFSMPSKFAIGAAGAINSAAMRLKQVVMDSYSAAKPTTLSDLIVKKQGSLSPEDLRGIAEYDALERASGTALAGNIAMKILSTAVPGTAFQSAATNLAARALPAAVAPTVAPTLGAAATGGTIAAATEPVLEGGSTLKNASLGAVGGAAGDLVARGLSRAVQPIVQSAPVKKLLEEGVIPTPGQAAGAKSFLGRFEQRLESLPILGDIITKGRTRAIEELNRAAVNRSVPEGKQVAAIGRKAIEQADEIFDDAYRTVLSGAEVNFGQMKIGPFKVANGLDDALTRVKANKDVFLTEAEDKALGKLVDNLQRRIPEDGRVTAEMAKGMDSFLGKVARERAADGGFANGVRELKRELRVSIADSLGGQRAQILKDIDSKYANFMRLLRASGATGSKEGIFSPEALQSAVRAMDPSKRAFAKGDALMQDLSEAGVNVLGRSVADSGTAGRALVGVGLLGAGGAANEFYGGPGYLTALALAPAIYSRAGSKFMVGAYPGQQSLADLARSAAPYVSQLGRAVASE